MTRTFARAPLYDAHRAGAYCLFCVSESQARTKCVYYTCKVAIYWEGQRALRLQTWEAQLDSLAGSARQRSDFEYTTVYIDTFELLHHDKDSSTASRQRFLTRS